MHTPLFPWSIPWCKDQQQNHSGFFLLGAGTPSMRQSSIPAHMLFGDHPPAQLSLAQPMQSEALQQLP